MDRLPPRISERIFFDERLEEFERVVAWLNAHPAYDPYEPRDRNQLARLYAFDKYDKAYP